ncbi:MAG: thioredoxin domain-containing protein [Chloroflexi bacterium]|nr:hypothetical protein [Chloroflexota bacterium]MBV6435397.1 hypothetical protein [Anaerolineae bacterium]MDL1915312.1 hypothetical protein [Anaerolineae bacterium CFX4]OQY82951.1 MAG: hypothetical protein B6D42_08495 [Anaerolineae bacterium UTCFX5]MBW7878288.1 thioredoxin domain-containing protein [Anaerolineae bacterium]
MADAAKNKSTTAPKAASSRSNQQTFLIAVIGAVALVAIVLVLVSARGGQSSFGEAFFAEIPYERLEDGGYVIGDPEARVTIVEFFDWYCPSCQQFKPTIDQVITEYVKTGRARYEMRSLPTAGANANPNTTQVANLLECVEEQKPGSYAFASEVAYELVRTGTTGANFSQGIADRTGTDFAQLLRCSQEATQSEADVRLARSLGVSSTPTVLYRIDGGAPQPISDRSFAGISTLIETFE